MFDFIDIDVHGQRAGGGQTRYKGTAHHPHPDKYHNNVKGDPREVKPAKSILGALSDIDIDPAWLAHYIREKGSLRVQRVFLTVILFWFEEWSEIHALGHTAGNRDAQIIGQTAMQIIEALDDEG